MPKPNADITAPIQNPRHLGQENKYPKKTLLL
jgi:hypothetical protein